MSKEKQGSVGQNDMWIAAVAPIRATGKAPKEAVEKVILQLCEGMYLTLGELARLLGRNATPAYERTRWPLC